jgi:hypothetical protein
MAGRPLISNPCFRYCILITLQYSLFSILGPPSGLFFVVVLVVVATVIGKSSAAEALVIERVNDVCHVVPSSSYWVLCEKEQIYLL